jgi:hypothetical protein
MNRTKTKILTKPEDEAETYSVTFGDEQIDGVSHYVYLGRKMTTRRKGVMEEVKRRVQLGWYAFGKIKRYLKGTDILRENRARLFNQCIVPVLTYGSETWSLTKEALEKLRKTERRMERVVLGV